MSPFAKIRSVAVCEYLKAVRSKAFIAGIVLMPLLFGAGAIAVAVAESTEDLDARSFAVIDRSERLLPVIRGSVERRNEQEIFDDEGIQSSPAWRLVDAAPVDDDAMNDEAGSGRADLALAQRVRDGELLGFLTIGADVFTLDGPDDELSWSTETPTADDLPDWLAFLVNETVRRARFEDAGLDPGLVDQLSRRRRVRTLGLATVDRTTGLVEEAEEADLGAALGVPVALAFLMFMLVAMSTPALMNNVLEEKMQKIAEVLVSSVSPFELLLGKLGSAVGVSMTLGLLYVGGAVLLVHNLEAVPPSVVEALRPGLLLWFLFFMLLGLVIYGSIFSAIGSACAEIQDSQTLMMPAMILFILPMMFLGPIIQSPDGTLAQVLSFFPPSTPVVMFLRMAVPPGVAWWELAVAIAATTAFALAMVWAGGRIFRVGILFQGQTPTLRQLVTWIWRS